MSLPQKENAMQSPYFEPASERSMIEHMNADHADSNLMYVQVYGNLWSATAAQMVTLDKEGMDLEVTIPDVVQRIRITFDHRLQDAADAQRTLVAMSRHAQAIITQTAQQHSTTS
jgi:putative heme iron utilization protein